MHEVFHTNHTHNIQSYRQVKKYRNVIYKFKNLYHSVNINLVSYKNKINE